MPPAKKRRLRRTCLVLAGLYLLFITVIVPGCHIADRMIILPNEDMVPSFGADRRAIPFQDGVLEAFVARSPGAQANPPVAYVLSFVGNGDRADRWATPIARGYGGRPVEVWAVNHPGVGGSTGPRYLARMGPAGCAAYDAIKREAGNRPVFIHAASLGTLPGIHVAANRPVAGMFIHNPPPLRQLVLGRHGWWNLWLLAGPAALTLPGDIDSVSNARRIHAPAVFLLSERDEIIPPAYHRLIVDAYAGPKTVITIPGGTHNSPVEGPAAASLAAAMDALWNQAIPAAVPSATSAAPSPAP